jgi:hypothetical protein
MKEENPGAIQPPFGTYVGERKSNRFQRSQMLSFRVGQIGEVKLD